MIEVQTEKGAPGETIHFDFGGRNVSQYVVGISFFKIEFEDSEHHEVKETSLSLSVQGPDEEGVHVTIHASISDKSSHSIDTTTSYVYVFCLAETGSNYDVTLTNKNEISSGDQSESISLPSSDLAIFKSCISGWDLSYDDDYKVKQMWFNCGLTKEGSLGYITGEADIIDNQHSADSASIDGGLIAANFSNAFNIKPYTSGSVTFDFEVEEAAVMITDWKAGYDNGSYEEIAYYAGGCKVIEISGNQVDLGTVYAEIFDRSNGTDLDDDFSKVDLWIIATSKGQDGKKIKGKHGRGNKLGHKK